MLAVAGEHVVVGGDALEEIGVEVVRAAVVRHLEQVDVQRPARLRAAPTSSRPSRILSPRASPVSSMRLAAGLGQHDDARQVRNGLVDVGGERASSGVLPFSFSSFSQSSCFFCSLISSGCIGPATVNVSPLGRSARRLSDAMISLPPNSGLSGIVERLGVAAAGGIPARCSRAPSAWTRRLPDPRRRRLRSSRRRAGRRRSRPARTAPSTPAVSSVGFLPMISSKLLCQKRRTLQRSGAPSASRAAPRVRSRMPWMWSSSTWLTISRSTGSGRCVVEPRASLISHRGAA